MKNIFFWILLILPFLLLSYLLLTLSEVKDSTDYLSNFMPDSAYVQIHIENNITEVPFVTKEQSTVFNIIYILLISYFVLAIYLGAKRIRFYGDAIENLSPDVAIGNVSHDRYGSAVLVQSLTSLLCSPFSHTPLSVAIDASWGEGKSSVVKMTQQELESVGIKSVLFNAWHHQNDKFLLSSLMESMMKAFKPKTFSWENLVFRINLFFRKVLTTSNGIMWLFFYIALIYIAGHIDIEQNMYGELVEPSSFVLFSLFVFKTIKPYSSTIVNKYKNFWTFNKFEGMVGLKTEFIEEIDYLVKPLGRAVVFIDDLDRCSDDKIFNIMQTINYMTAIPNLYIVMAVDREKIVDALERYYKGNRVVAEDYLNKIFNVTFKIPRVQSKFYENYQLSDNEKSCKQIKENFFFKKIEKLWMHWFGMITLAMLLGYSQISLQTLDKISASFSTIINSSKKMSQIRKMPSFDVDINLTHKIKNMESKKSNIITVSSMRREHLIPTIVKEELIFLSYFKKNFSEIKRKLLDENVVVQLTIMSVLLLMVFSYLILKSFLKMRENKVQKIWTLVHRIKDLNPREKNILFNKINIFLSLGKKKYVNNVTIGTILQTLRKSMFSFFYWWLFLLVVKVEEKSLLANIKSRILLSSRYAFDGWSKKMVYSEDDLSLLVDVLIKKKSRKDCRFEVIDFNIS